MSDTRILLIDDDWLSRKVYGEFLASEGYEVTTLGSAVEALETLEQRRFDVIISDLVMPEIDGIELITRVTRRFEDQPVILLTGYASADSAVAALKAGATDYLVKPVSSESLRLAVHRALGSRRLLADNQELSRYVHLFDASRRIAMCLSLDRLREVALDALITQGRAAAGWAVSRAHGATPTVVARGFNGASIPRLAAVSDDLGEMARNGPSVQVIANVSEWASHSLPFLAAFGRAALISCDASGAPALLFAILSGPGAESFSEAEIADLNFLRERIGQTIETVERFGGPERTMFIDDLTKLYNQRHLEVVVDREIARASEDVPHIFSLLFVDVDNFRQLNDMHGHMHGSHLLIELSRVLQHAFREFDTVFRLGGDEFAVYLHECSAPDAFRVAERFRARIAKQEFLAREELNVHVTVSIGVASFPATGRTRDEMLRLADCARFREERQEHNSVFHAQSAATCAPMCDSVQ